MNRDEIIGRWDIISWEQHYDDGRVIRPMGDQLEGFILYSSDGTMACFIARANRPRFPSGLQWDGTQAEKAHAYEGIMSYGGRFTLQANQVEHQVDVSLFPNWVGGIQKRLVTLNADELSISARLEVGTSEARTALLQWRRAT
jgi:hypothetical protein